MNRVKRTLNGLLATAALAGMFACATSSPPPEPPSQAEILQRLKAAEVYDRAHKNSAFYGLIAIAIALMAGWLGALGLRKA